MPGYLFGWRGISLPLALPDLLAFLVWKIHEFFFLSLLLPLASQSFILLGHHCQEFSLAQQNASAFLLPCAIGRWHFTQTQLLPTPILLGAIPQAPQLLHPVII